MILDEIAVKTKERIEKCKKQITEKEMKKMAYELVKKEKQPFPFPFEQALKKQGISFICEVKKASPSKGLIAPAFPYLEIARDYEIAGASAISVLTEPFYFQGNNEYLTQISKVVNIPLLRKDFTIDSYMLYEAKVIGASAVLLICAILSDEQLEEYLAIAHQLGLSALVEAHTKEEILRAIKVGARIIGVNNRDLQTFKVDVTTSVRLRKLVPENVIYISESGIKGPEEIRILKENRTDAVLIGETFMRSENKKEELEWLDS